MWLVSTSLSGVSPNWDGLYVLLQLFCYTHIKLGKVKLSLSTPEGIYREQSCSSTDSILTLSVDGDEEWATASLYSQERTPILSKRLFRTFFREKKNSLATVRIQTLNYPQ